MVEAISSGVRRLDHSLIQRLLFQDELGEATCTLWVLREAALERQWPCPRASREPPGHGAIEAHHAVMYFVFEVLPGGAQAV